MTDMTQAPTPGPLTATDWRVGDYAARLEDHPLVKAGEVHRVTEMFRGGYLGFAPPVGGEWNPRGWGKCDADGWMPWSGGENPVPGQVIDYMLGGNHVYSGVPSDRIDWFDGDDPIIAFRLAPTAPVEASGSEVPEGMMTIADELEDKADELDQMDARGQIWGLEEVSDIMRRAATALRPQPSGETRPTDEEIRSAIKATEYKYFGDYEFTDDQHDAVDILVRAAQALLSALALGGQHSTATDFPPDDVLACVDDTTPARAEAQDEGPRSLDAPCKCFGDSGMQASTYHDTDDKERCDLCGGLVSGGPEAQDEGAAGEPVAWMRLNDKGASTGVTDLSPATLKSGNSRIIPLYAHPSPTPAADADRVRELESEVIHLRDALLGIAESDHYRRYPKQHEDGGVRGQSGLRAVRALTGQHGSYINDDEVRRLDAEKRAALKSTAAKEGGE